jgi:hypothetical protein
MSSESKIGLGVALLAVVIGLVPAVVPMTPALLIGLRIGCGFLALVAIGIFADVFGRLKQTLAVVGTILFVTIIAYFSYQYGLNSNQTTPPAPIPSATVCPPMSASIIPTEIRLQFGGQNDLPIRITEDNIWRWYAMKTIDVGINPKTKKLEERITGWTIFLTLDKPINFSEVRVTSTNSLPRYAVQDSSERSAIIVIDGNLERSVLDVHFVP